MDVESVNTVIAIVTPAVIGLIKFFVPKLPSQLPVLVAPVLGAGLEIAQAMLHQRPTDPVSGAVAGALGVYVREVVDQMRKVTGTRPAAVIAAIGLGSMLVSGCGFRNPFGGDQNDDVLFAGDIGGAVCIGVTTVAQQQNHPEWIEQAKMAAASARGVLASSPATYDALRDALMPMVPPGYANLAAYFFDRLAARAANGVLDPESDAFAMAKAFIDACEPRLG